jgi:hypothetical protein
VKTNAGDDASTASQNKAIPCRNSGLALRMSRRDPAAATPMSAPTQKKCTIVQPAAVQAGE